MNERIKKLLESPIPEDIAIGLKILIKQTKVRKIADLMNLLENIKFSSEENLDLYVGRYNIFISYNSYSANSVAIWSSRMRENHYNYKVIRV